MISPKPKSGTLFCSPESHEDEAEGENLPEVVPLPEPPDGFRFFGL